MINEFCLLFVVFKSRVWGSLKDLEIGLERFMNNAVDGGCLLDLILET
ncbi:MULTISPECIES: hypothetical protein [unclassified Streptococcus]|nr:MULTISPECIES: hypothetical protein [unclassified Streptococcus]MBF0806762.1 hypothetical protein [Streptococcus sp. 19428wA2_WM07]